MAQPLNRVAQWVETPDVATPRVRPTLVLVGEDWYADFTGAPGDGVVLTEETLDDSFAALPDEASTAGYGVARIAQLASDLVSY